MERLVRSSADTFRLTSCCAALAAALAVSGCGGIAVVGSAVASGAEAVGTLFKKTVNEEDVKEDEDEAAPE